MRPNDNPARGVFWPWLFNTPEGWPRETCSPRAPVRHRASGGRLGALAALLLALLPAAGWAESVVAFNEIMYHPATNEPGLEWVELHNPMSVAADLSGWRLADGIEYVFPNNTVIQAGGYLVVAVSPTTLAATAEVTNLYGPFTGRLSNAGEKLQLFDLNQRLIDEVNYGSDGNWPAGADGAGVSLAKKHPNLASRTAESWTVSAQMGGTPGAANFTAAPLTGARTNLVSLTATWKYEDTGTDLGSAWRAPAYDDSAWPAGSALFFATDAPLPAPKNTPLAPGHNTYYFRGAFDVSGDPAMKTYRFRPLVDDGAVFYLNGVEFARLNMPAGPITYATMASLSVSNAAYSGPFTLPASNLVAGRNVLAVELHQTTAQTNLNLRISRVAAYAVTWDGGDGDFFSPGTPALAPTNAALASLGVDLFASSNPNLAANLNDGRYGGGSAWSPASNDPLPNVVLRFNRTLPISSIAWSRDNGDTNETACGGTCTDRAMGNYTFQYTLVTNPATLTTASSNPSNGWATIATVQYFSPQPGFTPHLRHRFDFAATNGNPILATGVRLRLAVTNSLDEIEINPPAVTNFDAVFGLELTATDLLPPPPKLAFNELAPASAADFWLEIINRGDTPAELNGVTIQRTAGGLPTYVFPPQTLPPCGFVALTQAQLGFNAADGQRLFLYTPGQFLLLDAVTVKTTARGRAPDGVGDWRYPAQPTPGASNLFLFHDEIAFNEIMYHHRPFDPIPAVTSNRTVVGIAGAWRYNDTGADLGSAWRNPGYDDSAWPLGTGLMAVNPAALPAAVSTVLAPDRTTYYFRTSFDFSGSTSNLALHLRSIVDDGAVFYLNGTEIHRSNLPLGPVDYLTSATTPIGDAAYADPVILPASSLVQGLNVLAVEVHQITSATPASGLVLTGGGLALAEEGPFGGTPPMNLARQPGVTPFVIDSLAGYPIHDYLHLNDGVYGNSNSWIGNSGSPGYAGLRFGSLQTLTGIAFGRDNLGVYTDRTLGLYTLQYTRVSTPGPATTVTGDPDTGWTTLGTLNYQSAGTGFFTNPSRRHRFTFTPVQATGLRLLVPGTGIGPGTCLDELEVNPPEPPGDIAFGAELVLSTTLVPAVPFQRSSEEWVELHNRSTHAVDLGNWRLDGSLNYRFPADTVLPAGGYLVVANDSAALRAKWPEIASRILGNFTGRLSTGEKVCLKDEVGNEANAITVYARGWSDGGGSSLELTDPRADNHNPAAWADSDETGRSAWQTVTYRLIAGQKFGSTFWNEFRLVLLDPGEVLVDDVSVLRDPDGARQQLIQNGDFEAATTNTHWRMLGDHAGSQIIPDPDRPANHVLKVSATAPPRTSHNHIESSFVDNTPLVDGHEYEVSYRARWLAGSPQVGTSAYMAKLAKATLLTLPSRHGTPGAENSRRLANAGPDLTELQHAPAIPQTNQAVAISVRATDPDGIASATLYYRVNPATVFTNAAMTPRADGTWTANLPGQAAGKIVQFYVLAQDNLGASAMAPAGGPASRALYQVADGQGTTLSAHELRLIQLDADRDFMLRATNVMSQALLGGTVVYDRSEVFYDVGVRLHGSAAGRARDGDDYINYTIAFPPTHLFRGVQPEVNIDRSGRSPAVRQQDEIYILHMFHRAGLPCHYSDLCYFIAPKTLHTGTAILQLSVYSGVFVAEQYPVDGSVFNYDLTYEPSTTTDGTVEGIKLPVPLQNHLGTDFADLGQDKEQYREPFDMRHGTRADDFSGLIRLCQTMALPQPQFDAQIGGALAVDEALRIAALTILCGIGDIYYSGGLPHNLRLFTPEDGGPAHFLPWDMDFVFNAAANSSIYPGASYNFGKFMNHPATLRRYLSHVNDLCQTVFTTDYMNPWLTHYGSVVGQNYSGSANYIQSRRAYALSQLPAAQPFAITTHNGQDFLTNSPLLTLTGSGGLEISDLRLSDATIPLVLTWITATNWQATVPLALGTNCLTFLAYDRRSNVLGKASLTVTSSALDGGLDTDGDGMPDAWELAHGLNPFLRDAVWDNDGDGLTNWQEFLAGTDPSDPRSYLRLEAAGAGGEVRLTFFAVAGRGYSVLTCDDPPRGTWRKLADVPPPATDQTVEISLTRPAPAPWGFFRLATPPLP